MSCVGGPPKLCYCCCLSRTSIGRKIPEKNYRRLLYVGPGIFSRSVLFDDYQAIRPGRCRTSPKSTLHGAGCAQLPTHHVGREFPGPSGRLGPPGSPSGSRPLCGRGSSPPFPGTPKKLHVIIAAGRHVGESPTGGLPSPRLTAREPRSSLGISSGSGKAKRFLIRMFAASGRFIAGPIFFSEERLSCVRTNPNADGPYRPLSRMKPCRLT